MEISLLKALLSNISSFLNLSSFENINSEPVQKYNQRAEDILKLLKPILNTIVGSEIASDEVLNMVFKGLGCSIEELREQFESWQPLLSKVYFVMEAESLNSKIRNCSLDILQFLKSSPQHLPEELSSASLEHYLQKIKHVGYEQTSPVIREAIRDKVDSVGPSSEILVKIAESLSLRSNQEILIEVVALEKLKENAEQDEKTDEAEFIDEMIALVTRMRDQLVLIKQSETCSPVPIPTDFCCPLSLELMTDPVIVASGQTYERAFIKQWIDLGLTVCPRTRQTLAHTNLIPNYTIKALSLNWCESNNVKLPDPMKSMSLNQPYPLLVHAESGLPRDSNSFPYSRSSQPMSPESRSRSQTIWRLLSERSGIEYRVDLSGIENQVKNLVEDLKSTSVDTQREATAHLRLLAKHNMDNRVIIANCVAISLLVNLLQSPDTKTRGNAVTALLNLSINDNKKTAIANANAIESLIHVLEKGSPEAKENSAATFISLSVIVDNKVKIGRSGAIKPLVDLLGHGTPRGKKDAATALFYLSIIHENKARIMQAGAVRHLVESMDPAAGMVEKAVAVLANLATIPEGRTAIGQEGGIPMLVEVVELDSARGKENAAAALLQLCTNSNRFCCVVLQEGAVPPLVALSQSGTPRAKRKAQALLSYFRNQGYWNNGRG
ncbi:hypothetical protein DITRI_Ditri18aG0084200 [Diplodiscus trichospermus]